MHTFHFLLDSPQINPNLTYIIIQYVLQYGVTLSTGKKVIANEIISRTSQYIFNYSEKNNFYEKS